MITGPKMGMRPSSAQTSLMAATASSRHVMNVLFMDFSFLHGGTGSSSCQKRSGTDSGVADVPSCVGIRSAPAADLRDVAAKHVVPPSMRVGVEKDEPAPGISFRQIVLNQIARSRDPEALSASAGEISHEAVFRACHKEPRSEEHTSELQSLRHLVC